MHQADLLERFLEELTEQIDDLDIYRRSMWRYPFDTLAIEALRKSRLLGEAVIVLLRANLEEEAYGLGRSIVELALNLRYITAEPSLQEQRTWQFVRHTIRDREYWLHWNIRRATDEATKRQFVKYGDRFGLKADGKSGRQHWTLNRGFIEKASELEHVLDPADLDADYRAMKRAGDYVFPSAFVHCSQRALDSKISKSDYKLTVRGAGRSDIDFGVRASDLAFQYIKEIVSYVLYGLGIPVPNRFTCLRDYIQSDEEGYRYVPGRPTDS